MSASSQSDPRLDYLTELRGFMQYLYEMEDQRAQRFHAATRTYLLFIGSTFAGTVGALRWLEISPRALLGSSMTFQDWLLLLASVLALLALVVSFLLTTLVIKVWPKERLCDPESFLIKMSADGSEAGVLEAVIVNFAVAADRNSKLNNRRGHLLGAASRAYRIGLTLLVVLGVLLSLR